MECSDGGLSTRWVDLCCSEYTSSGTPATRGVALPTGSGAEKEQSLQHSSCSKVMSGDEVTPALYVCICGSPQHRHKRETPFLRALLQRSRTQKQQEQYGHQLVTRHGFMGSNQMKSWSTSTLPRAQVTWLTQHIH